MKVLKDFALLWAMLLGGLLSEWLHVLSPLLPYSLFVMLLLSYTKVHPRDLKPKPSHYVLLVVQWTLGLLSYIVLRPTSELLAQGVALIILAPTATSAPVVTGMLGGSVSYVTTYLLPSNFLVAFVGPVLISLLYPEQSSNYWQTLLDILAKVSAILVLPLVIIWFFRFIIPKVHYGISRLSWLTFYVWVATAAIIAANAVHSFRQDDAIPPRITILYIAGSLLACILLYSIGHLVGSKMDKEGCHGRQDLGQKNTILAIWIASSFMDPRIALLPTLYIGWQNIINSVEISIHQSKLRKNNVA